MNINNYILLALFFYACQSNQPAQPEMIQANYDSESMKNPDTIKVDSTISLDYLLGKFDPKKDDRFVLVDAKYSDRSDRLLRKETYDAFVAMQTEAAKENVIFKIISATRNFQYQKGIWERKWIGKTLVGGEDLSKTISDPTNRALKILEYSSMPGSSRHHWGTDLDLNSFDNKYFEKGEGKKVYDWLVNNAARFGFCQPYTAKGDARPEGYLEERWHWSYTPLSKAFTEQAGLRIKDDMIQGFIGSEQAKQIAVVRKYILGINLNCLK